MADWSILGQERPVIRTARLVLDAPRVSDTDEIVALANDFEVARWLGRLPHPYGPEDAEFFFREVMPNELSWAIRPAGGSLAGIGGLMPRGEERAELGYWLGRPYHGRGYGREAVGAIVEFGFCQLGLAEIEACCFEGNVRSLAILRGLGFREVGRVERPNAATGSTVRSFEFVLAAADRAASGRAGLRSPNEAGPGEIA